MRLMAIDYGDARTGVAVSDEGGIIAGDAFVIEEWNEDRLISRLTAEAVGRGVSRIVVGYPKNMDGTLGPRAEKCRALAKQLEETTALEVILWDERRTTVDAHRILSQNGKKTKKHKASVDAVAAALILEGYIGSLR